MKYLLSLLCLSLISTINAQVGIGTTTPNPNAELEIASTSRGFLMPRLADTTAIASPAEGMMFYDLSRDTYMFYDGQDWKSLVFTNQENAELARYAGQVKVNGANGQKIVFSSANGNQVGGNLTGGAVVDWENIDFSNTTNFPGGVNPGDLDISSSPTTIWPPNVDLTQSNADLQSTIYNFTTGTWLENAIPGQTQIWRFILDWTKNSSATGLVIRLFNPNPNSSFDQRQLLHISPEHTSGTIVFNIVTIGDQLSIPGQGDPNANGYVIQIGADDPMTSITVDSITRISVSTN